MSLSARILLLFLGFSVLPVVFLGAGDYFQSVEALRAVLEARNDAMAEQAAREVEAVHRRTQAVVVAASGLAAGEGPVGPFSYVRVVEDEEPLRVGSACGDRGVLPVRMRLSEGSVGDVGGTVEAGLPLGTLLEWAPTLRTPLGEHGFVQVMDRSDGALLFDSRCVGDATGGRVGPARSEAVTAAVTGLPSDRQGHRSFLYDVGEEDLVAAVSTAGPAWAVVVNTSADEFIGPFRQARLYYLALVLLVMAIAAGAFLLLVQGAFRSLRLVTTAADQIELGNLRPWLPPPGDDEVGRLSLAFRRMTERLEESVRQAELNQKLAAVGELATYLSHEIRNPLSSIRLSLQSLHRDVRSGFVPTDSPRVIEIALNEVKRLDGVVQAVLEMGRPTGDGGSGICGVHDTLEETLEVLRPKVRAQGIDLVYAPGAGADDVLGDAGGLRSVMINLAVNAMDALEGRPDARLRISTWSDGEDELHVRIADNGPGVAPDVARSIFEPFFTTKARGNGIGLPTALRTVQGWGGTIVHEPVAAGSGAVFIIKLKLADPPVAEPATEETLITAQAS